jgi:hypothetical protein
MTFIKLQFRPGVNRDQTTYSAEGGWYACDKVRFRSGFPEKIGGWAKATPNTYYGVCRQMWNWSTTFGDNLLSLGTNNKLYIEDSGGNFYDITPISSTLTTPNTNNPFSTTTGSNVVTVNLGVAYGADTGNFVDISGVTTSIGGIPASQINGSQIITAVTSTSFTFVAASAATSTATNQGGTAITMAFEIPPGYAVAATGTGWGAGTWGRGAWGLGSTAGGVNLPQRDWFMNNFFNDLIANVRNGAMYYWTRGASTDPSISLNTRAVPMTDIATNGGYDPNAVPSAVMQSMVAQQYGFVLAFGAVPYGQTDPATLDPMLIRWSDQSNPGQWTPGSISAAGFIRVSRGSRIVAALPVRQEILVWTDQALYTLQFTGTLSVFGLQQYADNISVISPRCMTSASNITYWMGRDKFYAYTGRVETLPCTLRDYIFNNINTNQLDQIICGTNEEWNEVWWFYPSANSNWNDSYVVYNYLERIWYYGKLSRTAWLDAPARVYPQATYIDSASTSLQAGVLYNHESGVDDDGLPMTAFIQSNDFDLDDGEQFMLVRRLLPDIGFEGSNLTENGTPSVTVTMSYRNFPGNSLTTNSEDNATVISANLSPYTDQVFIRARGRQMTFMISSSTLGSQWQLGAPRIDARADGKR